MKNLIYKSLISILIIAMLFPCIVSSASMPSSWAAEEVNAAIDAGLITNAVQNDYQANITREQFCELVVKLYENLTDESVTSKDNPFSDTNNSEILKAYSLGIVKGVSDTEFAPNNSITRQEICVMLVRCISAILDDEFVLKYNFYDFDDNADIADWAFEQVYYAYEKNIIKGIDTEHIDPLGMTTCEQSLLMIYRIYKNIDLCRDSISPEAQASYNDYLSVKNDVEKISAKFEDENGYISLEDAPLAASAVYEKALALKSENRIKNCYQSTKSNNVTIDLNDGCVYLYSPLVRGTYSSDSNETHLTFSVLGMDNLGYLPIINSSFNGSILHTLKHGGPEYSANYLRDNMKECTKSYYSNSSTANLATIRKYLTSLNEKNIKVIFWRGHGGLYSNDERIALYTNEKVTAEANEKYSAYRRNGLILYCGNHYAITSKYIQAYMDDVDGGLFICGSCHSMDDKNNNLANIVTYGKGFDCFIGVNGEIMDSYSDEFLYLMAVHSARYDSKFTSSTITYKQAFDLTQTSLGKKCPLGAFFTLHGDTDKRLVDNNWHEAYEKKLKEEMKNNYDHKKFNIIYLDDNETPELLISEGMSHMARVNLYTFIDGQIKEVKWNDINFFGDYGTTHYKERSGLITANHFINGIGLTAKIIKVKDGNAEVTDTFEETFDKNFNSTYVVNGVSTTKEDYDNKWNGKTQGFITFPYDDNAYEITTENIQKVIFKD